MEQPGKTAPEMWRRPGAGTRNGPAERGARAGVRTLRPGGLGGPSAPTTRGCLQWLDEEETKGGESLPGQGVTSPASRSPPGSMGPGTQIAANWSAGWRARSRERVPPQRRTLTKGCAVRRSSPSLFQEGARTRGPARGRPKNTGDDVCPRSRTNAAHSRESGNPAEPLTACRQNWVPAFAGRAERIARRTGW